MATKKSTRVRKGDLPPTPAEIRKAKAFWRKTNGEFFGPRPENPFLGPDAADTLRKCNPAIKLLGQHYETLSEECQEARAQLSAPERRGGSSHKL